MQMVQVDHNEDLKRLRDEGFEIEVYGGYLIIHHIPYVNANREIKYGKLIVALSLNKEKTTRPATHVISFMGEYPCYPDGSSIEALRLANPNAPLCEGIVRNWDFSNKPPCGYKDHYEQVVRYAKIISDPAKSIDPKVTDKTFRVLANPDESVFCYTDSNSTRSNIYNINHKLAGQKIAIIGLGGTGSYILDMVAKTHVSEIHLFDDDLFCQHNAFRAPGAASISDFEDSKYKAAYFASVYSQMHKNIYSHIERISKDNIYVLFDMSYVFVCIDNDTSRQEIVRALSANKVPLADVGIGVQTVDDYLLATVRTTIVSPDKNDHIDRRLPIGTDETDNAYTTNIQIAELNALNAMYAVIEWKKMFGVYQDLRHYHNLIYTTNDSNLIMEDEA